MKESPDREQVPPITTRERTALCAVIVASTIGCILAASVPFELKRAAAEKLSRDGELGPSTISLIRSVSAVGAVGFPALIACWFGRVGIARALDSLLSALARPSARAFAASLFVGALVLRLVWIAVVRSEPTSDFLEYWELGKRLADTGAYTLANGAPTSFRPPGYPAFLAALQLIFGDALWPARIANCAFGAATALMTWLLFRPHHSEGTARLAAVAVALFPSQIGYTSLLATEIPFTALQLATLLALSLATTSAGAPRAAKWAALAGAALSIAAITRPTIVLLPLFVAPVIFARVGLRRMLLIGAVGALIAAPLPVAWGMRNARVLGAFQPFSTNGGVNFYFGNNAITNGTGFEMLDPDVDETSGICDEISRNEQGWQLGAQFWADQPGAASGLAVRKLGWLLATDGVWTRWSILTAKPPFSNGIRLAAAAISTAAWWLVLAFATIQVVIFRARGKIEPFSAATIICTLVTTALFIGQERYHFPLLPLLAGIAAAPVDVIAARYRLRDSAP